MWDFIVATLQRYPELAIFASLAIGYWIGVVKIGSFSLGTVTGTLLAAILIGQLGITVSAHVKSIFFIMFLFAVGYGVGPQFVRGVATDGLPQAIFAVVISVLCLLSVYAASVIAGYDAGYGAGLLAGSQTISAAMGLATDAFNGLGLPPDKVTDFVWFDPGKNPADWGPESSPPATAAVAGTVSWSAPGRAAAAPKAAVRRRHSQWPAQRFSGWP